MAAAAGDFTTRIGEIGACSSHYNQEGGTLTRAQAAARSAPVGLGIVWLSKYETRTFRVLCVDLPKSNNRRLVIHPSDAGWVARAVLDYMPSNIAPVFARARRRYWNGTKWLSAPLFADWISTQWICPECLPSYTKRYEGTTLVRTWDNSRCDPSCNNPSPDHVDAIRYGYDPAIMRPWWDNLASRFDCYRGLPGPLDPDTDVLCVPLLADANVCKAGGTHAAEYWDDLWLALGQAIRAANEARAPGGDYTAKPCPQGFERVDGKCVERCPPERSMRYQGQCMTVAEVRALQPTRERQRTVGLGAVSSTSSSSGSNGWWVLGSAVFVLGATALLLRR